MLAMFIIIMVFSCSMRYSCATAYILYNSVETYIQPGYSICCNMLDMKIQMGGLITDVSIRLQDLLNKRYFTVLHVCNVIAVCKNVNGCYMILYNQSDYNSVTCISIHGSTHAIIMPTITPAYISYIHAAICVDCDCINATCIAPYRWYPAGIFQLIVVIMFSSAVCVATAHIGYVCPDGWTGDGMFSAGIFLTPLHGYTYFGHYCSFCEQ